MLLEIRHEINYTYDRPVQLDTHIFRLRPQSNHRQSIHGFNINIHPRPVGFYLVDDLDGNSWIKATFEQETSYLFIGVNQLVETFCRNPFNFLLEPWAVRLPIDYPRSCLMRLEPYLRGGVGIAREITADIVATVDGNVVAFLTKLNQLIYETCEHEVRHTGNPYPPELTWKCRKGACRDVAVLFMECCRAVDLPARFVSGYLVGAPKTPDSDRHLHAWAEVYLPGAGWVGFDPTQGLVVADGHVALCASADPLQTAPVSGKLKASGVSDQMTYRIMLKKL